MKLIIRLLFGNIFILSIVFAWAVDCPAEIVRGEVKHSAPEVRLFTLKTKDSTLLLISWDKKTILKNLASPVEIQSDDYLIVDYFFQDGQMVASEITLPETVLPQGIVEASFESIENFIKSSSSLQALTLIDIRPTERFNAGHIPGAITIPFSRIEKGTAGLLSADKNAPLVFYDDGTETDAIVKAAEATIRRGYKKVLVFKEGVRGWVKSGRFLASSSTFIRKNRPLLIDLRNEELVRQGHIEGAVNFTLQDLARKRDAFPASRYIPVVVYGESESEAIAGAAIIRKWGFKNVTFYRGGTNDWLNSAETLEKGPASELNSPAASNHSGQLLPNDFKKALISPTAIEIVDVRSDEEYLKGHLQIGVHIPLHQIAMRHEELAKKKIQVVFAADSKHAEMAYDYLKTKGYSVNYLNGSVQFGKDGEYLVK